MNCNDCYYNRPMTAWGETFEACWYTHDNKGGQLYTSVQVECSGYDLKEKQIELELI